MARVTAILYRRLAHFGTRIYASVQPRVLCVPLSKSWMRVVVEEVVVLDGSSSSSSSTSVSKVYDEPWLMVEKSAPRPCWYSVWAPIMYPGT